MVKDRKTVKAELERASFQSAGKLSLRCVVEGLLGEGLSDCKRPLHSQGVLVASGPHARRNGGELSAARCQYSSRIRKLPAGLPPGWGAHRSEEHTSELQSLMRNSYAVFCLKNKKKRKNTRQEQE